MDRPAVSAGRQVHGLYGNARSEVLLHGLWDRYGQSRTDMKSLPLAAFLIVSGAVICFAHFAGYPINPDAGILIHLAERTKARDPFAVRRRGVT